jgi:hypothetical protein
MGYIIIKHLVFSLDNIYFLELRSMQLKLALLLALVSRRKEQQTVQCTDLSRCTVHNGKIFMKKGEFETLLPVTGARFYSKVECLSTASLYCVC